MFRNSHKYEMHCRRRITDGQKVSVFCVCGEALSLVGRNNKSAGKGSTNIQRSRNNKNKQWKFNKKVPTYNALEIIKINNGNSTKKYQHTTLWK